MRNIICINCSKKGHTFKDCSYPVTSYGIIAYKRIDRDIKILLVQRKDSIGYIDFVRGKYDTKIKKEEIFKTLIGEMTLSEKKRLLKYSFDELWNRLWMNHNSRAYNNDYNLAKKKFYSLDVKNMIKESLKETKWENSEFSIPKGRRNNSEPIIECAIREFIEETGFKKTDFYIDNNFKPIEEVFYGSNGISYKHIYYIAEIFNDKIPKIDNTNILQAGEIKYINWFSYKESMNLFRYYETTKREIVHKVYKLLNENKYYLKKKYY